MTAMTGASAGLIVTGIIGAVALALTFDGWAERRRDRRRAEYVRDRDGR